MPSRPRSTDDHERLSDLFAAHSADLFAYARRRGATPADAEEVVSDAFVVAWRRLDDLPQGAARGLLFAIARRVLANQRRGAARRARHAATLSGDPAARSTPAGLDGELRRVLDALRPADRELLELAAWEEMGPMELGVVLGISANAAAIRLHRARRRFAAVLAASTDRPQEDVKGSRGMRTFRWVKGSLARGRREVES